MTKVDTDQCIQDLLINQIFIDLCQETRGFRVFFGPFISARIVYNFRYPSNS